MVIYLKQVIYMFKITFLIMKNNMQRIHFMKLNESLKWDKVILRLRSPTHFLYCSDSTEKLESFFIWTLLSLSSPHYLWQISKFSFLPVKNNNSVLNIYSHISRTNNVQNYYQNNFLFPAKALENKNKNLNSKW